MFALLEDGAFHKRRTLLEQVKKVTLWLAGLAQGAKKSRIDMCNVSMRLWAPKPAKTHSAFNGVLIRRHSSFINPNAFLLI